MTGRFSKMLVELSQMLVAWKKRALQFFLNGLAAPKTRGRLAVNIFFAEKVTR